MKTKAPKKEQVNAVTLTDLQLDHWLALFPEYTPSSVIKALKTVIAQFGNLDAVTVDYYIKAKRFGGLQMGKRHPRNIRRHMKTILDDSLH